MTTVKVIYTITDFLKENVCPNVKYLLPAKEDSVMYQEKYVTPQVFPFFEPAKDRLPEGVEYTSPGVIVQLQQGQDNICADKSEFNIVLSFCTWRPGEYKKQTDTEEFDIALNDRNIEIQYSAGLENKFVRHEDGWKDVYHFMEETKKAIIAAGHIGNLKLKLSENIKYGPYTKDGAVVSFWPYYYLWMSFTLESIATPVTREYDNFL